MFCLNMVFPSEIGTLVRKDLHFWWFNGDFLLASEGFVANHHRLEGASTKYFVPRNFVATI